MIATSPLEPSAAQRRAGLIASVVYAAALASLTVIAVSWPEPLPSADPVPLDLGDPVSVALAFAQGHQALDPDACRLAAPRWRAQLGHELRCLPAGHRPRPEVRVLGESRSSGSVVAVVEVRAYDDAPRHVTIGLALVDDRWLVDSMAPAPVDEP
ncbi:hypothetical protein [Saccharothrix sp. NRRL B-16348]|uniref:hypothetical protein n=1 Tax=Saccharothrix sp. NRRL B-16348 TaxID=1415542 RepID=UPI000AF533E9|nr:hypothetical protein [Saccharothrix sp. NRRL B-16348]